MYPMAYPMDYGLLSTRASKESLCSDRGGVRGKWCGVSVCIYPSRHTKILKRVLTKYARMY